MPANLSCPNCGAPAREGPDSAQCGYCGSALATVACPSCFGAMFAGMQFCPHCGARGSRDLDDSATALACPGCETEMRLVRVGTVPIHECPSCSSNWVDTETFTEMCTNREQRGAVAAVVAKSTRTVTVAGAEFRYRPCPRCKKLMNRTNFGHRSGVVIDVCKGHGVWLEPLELHCVLLFVDSGGFERARAQADQRRGEEQRMLKSALSQGGRLPPMTIGRRDDEGDSMLERALKTLLF